MIEIDKTYGEFLQVGNTKIYKDIEEDVFERFVKVMFRAITNQNPFTPKPKRDGKGRFIKRNS